MATSRAAGGRKLAVDSIERAYVMHMHDDVENHDMNTKFRSLRALTDDDYINKVNSLSWCKCCCLWFFLFLLMLGILIGGWPGIIPLVNTGEYVVPDAAAIKANATSS